MNCEETTNLLSQYIDDVMSLPARVAVDEHLDVCPVCRAHVAELRSLSRSLAGLKPSTPPVDLASSIKDALMIEAAARRQSPVPTWSESIKRWVEPRVMPLRQKLRN